MKVISEFCMKVGRQVAVLMIPALMGGWDPAHAFESREHRETSSAAFKLAQAYLQKAAGKGLSGEALEAMDLMAEDYGYLVECVDFFLYPEKMLSYVWKQNGELEERDKTPIARGGIPDGKKDGEKYRTVPARLAKNQCDKEGALFVQASHNNHAHFQHDLLMSLRLWHFTAVAMAERENNYYGALFINAIADHYLQDFFAPGHIVTPRERFTDLPATATHDLANQMGALFRPVPTGKMQRILDFICGSKGTRPSPPSCDASPEVEDILARGSDGRRRSRQIENLASDVSAIRARQLLLFRGDGFLDKEEHTRQRLLLVIAQTASILDVMQKENTLKDVYFAYVLKKGLPVTGVDFGFYEFAHQGERYAEILRDEEQKNPVANPELSAGDEGFSYTQPSYFSTCSLGGCPDRLYPLRTKSPVVSMSVQRESQSSGAYAARNVFNVEMSTVGLLWDNSRFSGRWLSGLEVVPVLGYAFYRQGSTGGSGPTVRLTASVPETEFSTGPYLRWLSYSANDGSSRRLSYGWRIDSGFSGYFTFFLTGGIDYGVSPSGSLEKGRNWGADCGSAFH